MKNKDDGNRNLFIYACENNRVEILKMIITMFKISSDQKYTYKYTNTNGHKDTIQNCTGFIHACFNNNQNVVRLLIDSYPSIIK